MSRNSLRLGFVADRPSVAWNDDRLLCRCREIRVRRRNHSIDVLSQIAGDSFKGRVTLHVSLRPVQTQGSEISVNLIRDRRLLSKAQTSLKPISEQN
jgi:hypothetical protein